MAQCCYSVEDRDTSGAIVENIMRTALLYHLKNQHLRGCQCELCDLRKRLDN